MVWPRSPRVNRWVDSWRPALQNATELAGAEKNCGGAAEQCANLPSFAEEMTGFGESASEYENALRSGKVALALQADVRSIASFNVRTLHPVSPRDNLRVVESCSIRRLRRFEHGDADA